MATLENHYLDILIHAQYKQKVLKVKTDFHLLSLEKHVWISQCTTKHVEFFFDVGILYAKMFNEKSLKLKPQSTQLILRLC
jgi:hypothetical protein